MPTDNTSGPLGWYESFLWGVMDTLGVTRTVRRKVLAATFLQFGAILTIFVLAFVMLGPGTLVEVFSTAELAVFGVVFVLSVVALLNTMLILQRDFVSPIMEMQSAAGAISQGELDEGVPETSQTDEIGELMRDFQRMHEYLQVVSAQAQALSREEFDADVLDTDVPGSFGAALEQMEANLQNRIQDLEEKRAEMEAQNAELTETAEAYTRTIGYVADGDLTQRLDTSTDSEVMAEVARSFNGMVEEWEEMMADLIAFAREVAEESQAVRGNATEVRNASEDISQSVQDISEGVDTESRRIDEVSSESENLSATIQEITASSDNVATLADQTATVGDDGREAAKAAEAEMEELRDRSDAVTDAVETLNNTLAEIGEVTDVILDIADQTNILALNAGIEAARAESGGEGFAVVAEEVKSLAEETKESAEEIEDLIDEVQSQSQTTVSEIEEMAMRVETGAETVESATDAFEDMAENVTEINTSIKEVNEATAEQADSMQDVTAMIQEIASISDETAAEAQTVAAAAQEQAATLNQVAEHTTDLAEHADELEESLSRFDVRSAGMGTDRDRRVDRGRSGGHSHEKTESANSRTGTRSTSSADEFEFERDEETAETGPQASSERSTDADGMEWQSLATDGGDE